MQHPAEIPLRLGRAGEAAAQEDGEPKDASAKPTSALDKAARENTNAFAVESALAFPGSHTISFAYRACVWAGAAAAQEEGEPKDASSKPTSAVDKATRAKWLKGIVKVTFRSPAVGLDLPEVYCPPCDCALSKCALHWRALKQRPRVCRSLPPYMPI